MFTSPGEFITALKASIVFANAVGKLGVAPLVKQLDAIREAVEKFKAEARKDDQSELRRLYHDYMEQAEQLRTRILNVIDSESDRRLFEWLERGERADRHYLEEANAKLEELDAIIGHLNGLSTALGARISSHAIGRKKKVRGGGKPKALP